MAPNGHIMSTGGSDNTVRCWDLRNDYLLLQEYKFDSKISTLKYCPKGEWLAIGMDSGKIELLNISSTTSHLSSPSMKKIPDKYAFNLSNGFVRLFQFAHHGKWFITAGIDNNIHYYLKPLGVRLFETDESSSSLCCEISSTDRFIVTGFMDETAKVSKVIY
jgi:WD40 repeat protein